MTTYKYQWDPGHIIPYPDSGKGHLPPKSRRKHPAQNTGSPTYGYKLFAANAASFYGLPIPISAGKRHITGVPLWASKLRISDKGRKAFVDFAIGFGQPGAPSDELQSTVISKVWADGELIIDNSAVLGWNLAGNVSYYVYDGSTDQLPDPTIAAAIGIDSTPAFRGTTYAVFYNFPLHQFNLKRIPVIRAELVDLTDPRTYVNKFVTLTDYSGDDRPIDSPIFIDWFRQRMYAMSTNESDPKDIIHTFDVGTLEEINVATVHDSDGTHVLTEADHVRNDGLDDDCMVDPFHGYLLTTSNVGDGIKHTLLSINPTTGAILGKFGHLDGTIPATGDPNVTGPNSKDNGFDDFRGMAAVSANGGEMYDTLIASYNSRGSLGIVRIWPDGFLENADANETERFAFDDNANLTGIATGDPCSTKSPYGTVFVSDTSKIYRVVVPRGIGAENGLISRHPRRQKTPRTPRVRVDHRLLDGDPSTITGTNEGRMIDYVIAGRPSASINDTYSPILNTDVGNTSDVSFNDTIIASVDFGEDREITQMEMRLRRTDAAHGGYSFAVSSDGVNWEQFGEFDENAPVLINGVYQSPSGYTVSNGGPGENEDSFASSKRYTRVFVESSPHEGQTARYVGLSLRQPSIGSGETRIADWRIFGHGGTANSTYFARAYARTVVTEKPKAMVMFDVQDIADHDADVIRSIIVDPDTCDIYVFHTDGVDSFLTRLEMTAKWKGNPKPKRSDDAVTRAYTITLPSDPFVTVDSINDRRRGWTRSPLDGGTLAYMKTSNELALIALKSGFVQAIPLPGWRYPEDLSDEGSAFPIVENSNMIWVSGGGYFMASSPPGNIDIDPTLFGYSKIHPFRNINDRYALSDILRWFAIKAEFAEDEVTADPSITAEVTGSLLLSTVAFGDLTKDLDVIFSIDTYESEGMVKFTKPARGDALSPAIEVPQKDLCHLDEGEDVNSVVFNTTRDDANEQPREIDMLYVDETMEYTVNEAHAVRPRFPVDQTVSERVDQYHVPVILKPDEAALYVSQALFAQIDTHSQQEFRLSPKYLACEPSDVANISVEGVTYTVRLTDTTINTDWTISCKAANFTARDDIHVTGETPLNNGQVIGGPSQSQCIVIDTPPIDPQDAFQPDDNALRVYTAGVSFGQPGWTGAELQTNLGSEWTDSYHNVTDSGAWGRVVGVFPYYPAYATDNDHVLTVQLTKWDSDALVTVEQEDLLDGVTNRAFIGNVERWELIQFREVTSLGNGLYEFRGIVRGLRGTEDYVASHVAGDFFILVDEAVQFATVGANALYSDVLFRAVGDRTNEANATVIPATMAGKFERPWAPIRLQAAHDGDDIVLNWTRRTRAFTELPTDGFDTVPLEYPSEAYEIDILDAPGGSVVRTITATDDPAAAYLAADILADFDQAGSDLTEISFIVYQMSPVVDRGHAAVATVAIT